VREIRGLVTAGELGQPLYFDSVRINLGLFQQDSNVLWDLGPHDFSIAQYVFGCRPQAVSAVGVRHFEDAPENLVYATLRYDGPLIAHFHFNWFAPLKARLAVIGGTRRMLVYDAIEPVEKIKVNDRGVEIPRGSPLHL